MELGLIESGTLKVVNVECQLVQNDENGSKIHIFGQFNLASYGKSYTILCMKACSKLESKLNCIISPGSAV